MKIMEGLGDKISLEMLGVASGECQWRMDIT